MLLHTARVELHARLNKTGKGKMMSWFASCECFQPMFCMHVVPSFSSSLGALTHVLHELSVFLSLDSVLDLFVLCTVYCAHWNSQK